MAMEAAGDMSKEEEDGLKRNLMAKRLQHEANERQVCFPHGPLFYSDAQVAKRNVSGGRSFTRPFRDARRFPSTRL
jgi:hypothetical protein